MWHPYSVFSLTWTQSGKFCWLLAFVNFITLITLRWFGQFISSRQLFLAIIFIAFLYISNSMCTGVQLWNSQTGFKLTKRTIEKPAWCHRQKQTGPEVDLNWACFSVHTRTERYDIVSFQFLVHFSVPPNFWTCFGTYRLIFFPYQC